MHGCEIQIVRILLEIYSVHYGIVVFVVMVDSMSACNHSGSLVSRQPRTCRYYISDGLTLP